MSPIEFVILPRYKLPEAFTTYGCKVVISILETNETVDTDPPTPQGVIKTYHHRHYFDDLRIGQECEGWTAPTKENIKNILDLYPAYLPRATESKIFLHCYAAVSRSPAVAFSLYCKALGEGLEDEAMELTEKSAPYGGIEPNDLIVSYADELLERAGKMNEALKRWKAKPKKVVDNPLLIL